MESRPETSREKAAYELDLRKRMRLAEEAILQRAPEHDLAPSLDRIRAVMEILGDPQRAYPVIHLTGTNGKTSTTRIIETLLREMGLTTGRFTSPHLHDIRERIAIGGEPISRAAFLQAYDEVLPIIEHVDARSAAAGGPRMTYFEVLVAVAYVAFSDAPVDVAVVEVGMGGSWDATNVADGVVSVVTTVDLDHQHFLGSTVEEIATEKAGIIKHGAVTVSAVQAREVGVILAERAAQVGARLIFEGSDFGVLRREVALGGQLLDLRGLAGEYPEVFLPLHGAHQASNAVLALAAVEAFIGGGDRALEADVVREGFAAVTSPGRLEVVRRSPTILVDSAHNPAGARALREAVEEAFAFTRLVGVIAVFADKDAFGILEELQTVFDEVVVTCTSSRRAMKPAALAEVAVEVFGDERVTVVANLPDAIEAAAAAAERDGLGGGVLATGSVVTAAEVRLLLGADST
jgi:dihydrofolate synthase/folylpolyglutamate synthase